ncbi:MAG: patatin-like phospholipase RssA [Oxalobacter sp.]|nr:MAG: patatin-like phospholipase RssA [Oxalobacter sp.]
MPINRRRKPRIGLALGGGAARGWAHIGVIRALEERGIRPELVCGTSIGALVGSIYASGEMDRFEAWLHDIDLKMIVSLLDIHLNGGVLRGERLMDFFRKQFGDQLIENLKLPFGAVATALHNGAEVWMRNGSTTDAVRASIAVPGMFSPIWRDDQLLVDGGLVNPVPVSLARAMGADLVIAVDLNSDDFNRLMRDDIQTEIHDNPSRSWVRKVQDAFKKILPSRDPSDEPELPSVLDIMAASITIMQVRITRSRLAGDPPDVLISPQMSHIGLMEFHRAKEGIEEGRQAVALADPHLRALGLIP